MLHFLTHYINPDVLFVSFSKMGVENTLLFLNFINFPNKFVKMEFPD
jgi:hypothetical protein